MVRQRRQARIQEFEGGGALRILTRENDNKAFYVLMMSADLYRSLTPAGFEL